jgi:hypothetical protein
MAAPTTAACVKKTLANPEPSTHGPMPRWFRAALVMTAVAGVTVGGTAVLGRVYYDIRLRGP